MIHFPVTDVSGQPEASDCSVRRKGKKLSRAIKLSIFIAIPTNSNREERSGTDDISCFILVKSVKDILETMGEIVDSLINDSIHKLTIVFAF